MWQCSKCKEAQEESFDLCWNCGTSREGVEDATFSRAEDAETPPPPDNEEITASPSDPRESEPLQLPDEAAELGRQEKTYWPSRAWARKSHFHTTCAFVFAVVVLVLPLLYIWFAKPEGKQQWSAWKLEYQPVTVTVFCVPVALLLWYVGVHSWRSTAKEIRTRRLVLFQEGLLIACDGKFVIVRWDEIAVLYSEPQNVGLPDRGVSFGLLGALAHAALSGRFWTFRIQCNDGFEVRFSNFADDPFGFEDVLDLGDRIERALCKRYLPALLQRYTDDEELAFGPVRLKSGVFFYHGAIGKKRIPLGHIKSMRRCLEDGLTTSPGSLEVFDNSGAKWLSADLAKVPNACLLLALLDHLLKLPSDQSLGNFRKKAKP